MENLITYNSNLPVSISNPNSYFCAVHQKVHKKRGEIFCNNGHLVCTKAIAESFNFNPLAAATCSQCKIPIKNHLLNLLIETYNRANHLREETNVLRSNLMNTSKLLDTEIKKNKETLRSKNTFIDELLTERKELIEKYDILNASVKSFGIIKDILPQGNSSTVKKEMGNKYFWEVSNEVIYNQVVSKLNDYTDETFTEPRVFFWKMFPDSIWGVTMTSGNDKASWYYKRGELVRTSKSTVQCKTIPLHSAVFLKGLYEVELVKKGLKLD